MSKKKIKAGFAILNIVMGVILFMSSFIMLSDKDVGAYGLISMIIGLTLWIVGAYALYIRRKSKADDELDFRNIKLINTICFVISVLILTTVIVLPIIGPHL